ncbi:MAG: hypothetical protein PW792_17130 [Acidobacteriaceae bacterium]|nr:hypothetical protein [Acidobacteriaceae bacterium]
MIEVLAEKPSRAIRIFSSHHEQERETIRFWNSKSMEEKLQGTLDAIELAYALKGIDVHSKGSNRSVVRVQPVRG